MHGNAPLQVLYFWKQQPRRCKLLARLTTAPLEYRISTLDLEEFVRFYAQKELKQIMRLVIKGTKAKESRP